MEPTTILVIDDCHDVRQVLSTLLQHEGYQVRSARDVCQALTALDRNQYQAVICDLVLPLDTGMEKASTSERIGMQCISQMRERHPKLPIVAMSGESEDTLISMTKRLGVQAVLPKPFGLSDLKMVLQAALSR